MQNTPSNVNFISDLAPGNGNDATPFAQQSVVLTKGSVSKVEMAIFTLPVQRHSG